MVQREVVPGAPSRPTETRATIRALTGIRALAAGWVVLQHYMQPLFDLAPGLQFLAPVVRGGYLGVEVFFVLSGFIISYNYADRFRRFSRGSYRTFLWARFARIYPVHLMTLAVMGALVLAAAAVRMPLTSEARNTVGNFTANVFMVQAWPGFRAINWPAWSVACEAAAYLAFPLLAAWVVRLRPALALISAAVVLAAGVLGVQLLALSGKFWSLSYPMMWLRITVEFTAGCLLWAAWRWGATPSARWDAVALAAAMGTIAVLYATGGKESPVTFTAVPLIAVFVVACASATGPFGRLLAAPLTEWGGRISYSLYMTHFIVFLVTKKLVGWERFVAAPLGVRVAVLIGYALTTTAVAAATFYAVEEPGRRLVRRWSTRSHRSGTVGAFR
jgi:peptidoglycan/LPS O-acetylase OafA/YrhL